MTPRTAACQTSLSITNSQRLLKLNICWVGDAIQPSHPLLSPSPPAFNLSQHLSPTPIPYPLHLSPTHIQSNSPSTSEAYNGKRMELGLTQWKLTIKIVFQSRSSWNYTGKMCFQNTTPRTEWFKTLERYNTDSQTWRVNQSWFICYIIFLVLHLFGMLRKLKFNFMMSLWPFDITSNCSQQLRYCTINFHDHWFFFPREQEIQCNVKY